MELLWTADADEELSALEQDPVETTELRAVRRTLARLEADPYEPRLATLVFATEGLGHVRATPTGAGEWYVLWQAGPPEGAVTILHVLELSV